MLKCLNISLFVKWSISIYGDYYTTLQSWRKGNPKQLETKTLLNVDYKIIKWVLAARLKMILPYIVDDDQKGYVDKRNISDTISLNEDVIFHSEKSGKQGIILYVDQSKAFDRVEWQWMRLVLEMFNFG